MDKSVWRDDAARMHFDEGLQYSEIVQKLREFFPADMHDALINKEIRDAVRSTARYKQVRNAKPVDAAQEPAKPKVEKIMQNLIPEVVEHRWSGERVIRFGLMGDTQINSKYTQLTHLHNFYDICASEGIENVYNTGDIDEGEQMRAGHQYECYNQGADDHADEIVRVYPKRNGMTTHFITGNHDASMIKHCGFDIGRAIAEKRKDMTYLGRDCAIIQLTPECSLELRHPWDGTSYAISYKTQKMIDAMSGGEKPNMLGVGHYHKQENILYRNVYAFQTGCFQAQTPFLRGHGIAITMGGWIVEAIIRGDGTLARVNQSFIPYFKAIKEDYKNFVGVTL